jgi:hypothetical protein
MSVEEGESGEDLNGSGGGRRGSGAASRWWCGPNNGSGGTCGGGAGPWHELDGGWWFIGVDLAVVGEAVSEELMVVEAVEERVGTWVVVKWRIIVVLGFKGQLCD